MFFFMMLMPQGAFWELLSSGRKTTMGLFVKSQDGRPARASLLRCGGERAGTPPGEARRFAVPELPVPQGGTYLSLRPHPAAGTGVRWFPSALGTRL